MTWADLLEQDPDVIIVMPCGFDIARTRHEMKNLTELPEWDFLKAVKQRSVYIADGTQYSNRPGPRLVDSLEILMEIFYSGYSGESSPQLRWIKYLV